VIAKPHRKPVEGGEVRCWPSSTKTCCSVLACRSSFKLRGWKLSDESRTRRDTAGGGSCWAIGDDQRLVALGFPDESRWKSGNTNRRCGPDPIDPSRGLELVSS